MPLTRPTVHQRVVERWLPALLGLALAGCTAPHEPEPAVGGRSLALGAPRPCAVDELPVLEAGTLRLSCQLPGVPVCQRPPGQLRRCAAGEAPTLDATTGCATCRPRGKKAAVPLAWPEPCAAPTCAVGEREVIDTALGCPACASTWSPIAARALDLLDAGGSTTCDGISARAEPALLITDAGPIELPVALAASLDTCAGGSSPNASNHAVAIAIDVQASGPVAVTAAVHQLAPELAGALDCWLVVRVPRTTGEHNYLATRHDAMAAGGGSYLADGADRAYLACDDADRAATVPTPFTLALGLVPR